MSETLATLRRCAQEGRGPLLEVVDGLRDATDLPAAARPLLYTGTETERRVALAALARAPHRAEEVGPVALSALNDPSPGVRAAASAVLGELGWSGALPALLDRMQAPDPKVRAAVNQAAVQLDSTLRSERLQSWVAEGEAGEVLRALEVGRVSALPACFVRFIESPLVATRAQAARLLGQAGDPRLEQLLYDPSAQVVIEALSAMVHRRQALSAQQVEHLLPRTEPSVRLLLLAAIVSAQGPHAPPLRASAARASGHLPREAAPQVEEALAEERDERVASALLRSLAALAGADSLPTARAALLDPRRALRLTALDLLGRLGGPSDLELLQQQAAQDHPLERAARAHALEALGASAAPPRPQGALGRLVDPGGLGAAWACWSPPNPVEPLLQVWFTRLGEVLRVDEGGREQVSPVGGLGAGAVKMDQREVAVVWLKAQPSATGRAAWRVALRPDPWSERAEYILEYVEPRSATPPAPIARYG